MLITKSLQTRLMELFTSMLQTMSIECDKWVVTNYPTLDSV